MSNYSEKLAKMFKERENKQRIGPLLGTVVSSMPELKISILDGDVILYKDQLYMCDHLWSDYYRTYKVDGNINEQSMEVSASQLTGEGSRDDPMHNTHKVESWEGTGSYKATGDFWFTDTLVKGDLVFIVPTIEEQIWFVVDKVRKVG
jgi:hypothetical protein